MKISHVTYSHKLATKKHITTQTKKGKMFLPQTNKNINKYPSISAQIETASQPTIRRTQQEQNLEVIGKISRSRAISARSVMQAIPLKGGGGRVEGGGTGREHAPS